MNPTSPYLGTVLVVAISSVARGQALAPSPRNGMPYPDTSFKVMVANGQTLYVGGDFTGLGAATGGFSIVDHGSAQLVPGLPAVSGAVKAIAPDGQGGWFIGGTLDHVNATKRSLVAHILADGSLAPWAPKVDGSSVEALFTHDGKVYMGGVFSGVNDLPRQGFVVVDAQTGQLIAPNPKMVGSVFSMVSVGGTLYLGGSLTSIYNVSRGAGAAIDLATGTLLPWDPATSNLSAMAAIGNVMYLGGGFATVGGAPRNRLAAVDLVTGAVLSWHPEGPDKSVEALRALGTRLLVGGRFTVMNNLPRTALASFDTASGTLEGWAPNVGGPGVNEAHVVSIDVDGRDAIVAGEIGRVDQSPRRSVAKVDLGTGKGTPWDAALAANTYCEVALLDAGRIAIGGDQVITNLMPRAGVAAIDLTSGTVPPWKPEIPLPPGYVPRPTAIAVLGEKLYITGNSIEPPSKNGPTFFVAVDALTGAMDPVFDPAYGATASADLEARPGRVYMIRPTGVRALDADTGDLVWDAAINGTVSDIEPDAAGENLYISRAADLYCIEASTGVVRPWTIQCGNDIRAMRWHNGVLYIGGQFTTVNGVGRPYAAAIDVSDPASPVLTSWSPQPSASVEALAVRPPVLLLGGTFDFVAGTQRKRLAAVDLDGAWLYDWAPTVSAAVTRFAMGETTLAMRAGVYIEDLYAPGWAAFDFVPCPADFNGDWFLDIEDFIEFQTGFGLGDPRADCDGSGDLDVDDFICFQTAFGMGCPGY